jgi:hypothetical protein
LMALQGQPDPDPRWWELFRDLAALEEHVNGWQVGEAVPDDMAGVLRTARLLLVHSYLVYEFAHVAVTWGLLALEAALCVCLGAQGRQDLGRLLRQTKEQGLITDEEFTALGGIRELRNMIVHGGLRSSSSPSSAVEMVAVIHEAISDIYARAARA